ncbi:MAG: DNA polymerase I [Acidobacteriota bacterium]|nr:DNA polymerase I [Acidobacteriota bacterium]
MTDRPRLYLIDGNSQMYRAYHALRGLTAPDGRSTNAVYGFVTMLRKLVADHRPAFIAASFDLAGPTFRSALAEDYKANRAPMPDDLVEQVPLVHEACEALGVPIVTMAGYEADDVIGTIAKRAAAAGYEVALVTGDKDFFQLVGDGIRVFNPRDEGTWYDAAGVKEKFGVEPAQVVDTLALMGDAVDNVKGVPGIGEKGARELIEAWGSLDALLAHAAEVKQKKYREGLQHHADLARQSRDLVRIHTDVPVAFDLDAFRYQGPSRERCYRLFSDLGFRSLLNEYAPTADTVKTDYALVTSTDGLHALVDQLRRAGRFALQVLTDDGGAMTCQLIGLAFSAAPRMARYVPLGHSSLEDGPSLDRREVLAALGPVLADPAVAKVGHDLKFTSIVLARHGVELQGLDVDIMLASYLLDAGRSGHPIEEIALEQVGYKALTREEVCGKGAKAIPLARVPAAGALTFAGERSDLALQLAAPLAGALTAADLERVFRGLEMPLVPVLAGMERIGVRIDTAALAAQSARLERDLAERTARIVDLAGEEFNINSPKQLSEILFDKLKLPALKRTGKTKTASTAVEVLEELALVHDLPRQILEWRTVQKLKGTYIDALPQLVNPATGRVHTSFNQAVAATGRLSSSDPNLQNIPIRTELGREIRAAFVADPGCVLISADYSQIELRVLAHLAQDETLIEAFRRGDDIHEQTALKVFGPSSSLDPHELRRRAKIINYALLYGKTAFTLARDIGVPPQAAQQFIDAYFAGFPRVRGFIDRTLAEARETGVVKTMAGRRRTVPELNSRNGQIRSAAERIAVNLPIQGSAADVMKQAMIDVQAALDRRRAGGPEAARMILTVHDELLFEVPEAEAEEVAALVRDRMEHAVELSVPLTVDVGIGKNWKDAKG